MATSPNSQIKSGAVTYSNTGGYTAQYTDPTTGVSGIATYNSSGEIISFSPAPHISVPNFSPTPTQNAVTSSGVSFGFLFSLIFAFLIFRR